MEENKAKTPEETTKEPQETPGAEILRLQTEIQELQKQIQEKQHRILELEANQHKEPPKTVGFIDRNSRGFHTVIDALESLKKAPQQQQNEILNLITQITEITEINSSPEEKTPEQRHSKAYGKLVSMPSDLMTLIGLLGIFSAQGNEVRETQYCLLEIDPTLRTILNNLLKALENSPPSFKNLLAKVFPFRFGHLKTIKPQTP